jgi:hypothetical protein
MFLLEVYTINVDCQVTSNVLYGNDTIDSYPLPYGEIEKILCVSERTFKEIQKDFTGFFKSISGQPRPRSLNIAPLKRQTFEPKPPTEAFAPQLVKIKNTDYEPSNTIYLQHSAIRRWRRVNEWFRQYAHGIE